MENSFILAQIALELGVRKLEYPGLILLGKMTRAQANLRFCALHDVQQLLKDEKPLYTTTHQEQLAELNKWMAEVRRQVGEDILAQQIGSAAGRKKVAAVEDAIKFIRGLMAMAV